MIITRPEAEYFSMDGEPAEVLLGLQDRFETHFLGSPAWQRARAGDRRERGI